MAISHPLLSLGTRFVRLVLQHYYLVSSVPKDQKKPWVSRAPASMSLLISLLWTANMIQLGLRYSWGVALPQASPELGMSSLQAGAVASAFYAGYVATGIPSGYLVDRMGTKSVTLFSLSALGLLAFSIGFTSSFVQLAVLFLFSGIFAGPIFPASLKSLSERLPPTSRATGVGLLETVSPAAMIAAATLFPITLYSLGWRYMYYGLGFASLVCALVYFLLAPASSSSDLSGKDVVRVLANAKLSSAVVMRLGGMWGIIALSAWFYDFGVKFTGALNAQVLYVLLASFAVLGQVAGGYISDRLGRLGVAALGMLLFGMAVLAFLVARTFTALLLLAPLLGFTAFFWKSGLDTYILESVDRSKRGSAVGFMNTVSQLGSLVAPAAVGYALDLMGSLSPYPYMVLASGPLASAAVMFVTMARRRG